LKKLFYIYLIIYSPHSSQRAQSDFSFSFAVETPANENHHAFGNLDSSEYYPAGLVFILFRPLSEKK